MSGHTQGPWVAKNWTCHAPTTVMRSTIPGENQVIAECSGNGTLFPQEMLEANARLIAAAPDLLAALIEAVKDVENHIAGLSSSHPYKLAIAKATGQPQATEAARDDTDLARRAAQSGGHALLKPQAE